MKELTIKKDAFISFFQNHTENVVTRASKNTCKMLEKCCIKMLLWTVGETAYILFPGM